jgi:phosphatidylinositol glycan class B
MVYGGVELPWEWSDAYKLRSVLYPVYLAIPFWFLKITGLDYYHSVILAPKIAHIILTIVCDSYLWKIGKLIVGKDATRVAMFVLFFSRLYNDLMIRTFTNSIETIFQIIAFYYFLKVTNKFDKNIALLTALLTVSFMIRNTSPIGWPPLILIKVIKDRSLIPFIIAFVTVFIPVVFVSILIDSSYYNEFPVITSLNFMRVNLSEGLSKYFGSHPVHFYFTRTMPMFFTVSYPAVLYGFYAYTKDKWDQTPFAAILSGFYVLIFSIIAHKEDRFLLPIIPFCGLMAGYAIYKWANHGPSNRISLKILKLLIYVYILVEVSQNLIMQNYQDRHWEIPSYLAAKHESPHSVYFIHGLAAPY